MVGAVLVALVCGLALGAVLSLAIVLPLHLSDGASVVVGVACGVFGVSVAIWTFAR